MSDFTTWSKPKQFEHVKKMLKHSYEEFKLENECPLADVVDVWDYWAPWLVSELEKAWAALEKINTDLKKRYPVGHRCHGCASFEISQEALGD